MPVSWGMLPKDVPPWFQQNISAPIQSLYEKTLGNKDVQGALDNLDATSQQLPPQFAITPHLVLAALQSTGKLEKLAKVFKNQNKITEGIDAFKILKDKQLQKLNPEINAVNKSTFFTPPGQLSGNTITLNEKGLPNTGDVISALTHEYTHAKQNKSPTITKQTQQYFEELFKRGTTQEAKYTLAKPYIEHFDYLNRPKEIGARTQQRVTQRELELLSEYLKNPSLKPMLKVSSDPIEEMMLQAQRENRKNIMLNTIADEGIEGLLKPRKK